MADDNIQAEILGWKRFKNGRRWKYVVNQLNKVILTSEEIIKKPGTDGMKHFTERDIHIIKQQLAQELIESPDRYIMLLDGTFNPPEENDDAYMSMYGNNDDADSPVIGEQGTGEDE